MNSNNNQITNNSYPLKSIKVVYFTKEQIISKVQFFTNSQFKSILTYFNKNLKKEGKTKLKQEYIFNDTIINPNEPIINLLKKNSLSFSSIESAEILIEIDKNENKENDNILLYYDIIIQPKINPFGLYVYLVKEGIINTQIYPEKIYNKYELNKYSDFSAYCNSPKFLFISGGQFKDLPINDFWIINNKKYSIVKKNMPIEKSNHSMIYINFNNKEYIFIAGGNNNLITSYYDINLDSFEIWGDMNNTNIKPALYQYKKYLYCFNSLSNYDNNNYFERTDLTSKEHIWEKIFPVFDNETINFKTESFGVSNSESDNIILVGGEKDLKYKTLIYDPKNDCLSLSEKGKNQKISLFDKSFYQVDNIHNVALPSNLKTEKEIAVVNKINQSVKLVKFNLSDGKNKVKFNQSDYGKIIVKINERKRFNKQPKIVSEQNITIIKDKSNLSEQEILKVELRQNINKNEEKIKLIQKHKKYIYLPYSVVYNNLIDILVNNSKIKNKTCEKYKNLSIIEKPKGDEDISDLKDFEISIIDKNNDDKQNKNKVYVDGNKIFEIKNNNISLNINSENNKFFEIKNIENFKGNKTFVQEKNNNINNNNNFVIVKNINFNNNENYNENFIIENNVNNFNFKGNEINSNYDENDEEREKRDEFDFTIKEPLEEDIIMIEEYIANYYDINNFADYDLPE